jgi:hypothetical protein
VRIFAVLVVLIWPAVSMAWNSLGHKVVAEIAWQQLKPEQRTSIVEVLRRHPKFDRDFADKMDDNALTGDKAIEDHWIFLHAATWPDIIRKDKEYDRPEWHYIDIPTFLDPSDRQAFYGKLPVNIATDFPSKIPQKEFNVVQAIQLCKAMLASNAGPDVKAMAYCWLLHLVGDVHQPLHCTALFSVEHFPKGDRGGNEIKVTKGKNLHSTWDGLLGRQYFMRDAMKAAAELSDKRKYADVWESASKEIDPRKWAEEGHAVCESAVYSEAILTAVRNAPAGQKLEPIDLPESYYTAAGEAARKQIIKAGVRLAAALQALP